MGLNQSWACEGRDQSLNSLLRAQRVPGWKWLRLGCTHSKHRAQSPDFRAPLCTLRSLVILQLCKTCWLGCLLGRNAGA